jgi:copper chaperone CopZ
MALVVLVYFECAEGRKRHMKRLLCFSLLCVAFSSALAEETSYELRVDGLACPYCAYGIEKKLKALDGLNHESLKVKLNEGLILFQMNDTSAVSKSELKQLINDSGFTLRGVKIQKAEPRL